MPTIDESLKQAIGLHQAGRLAEAEQLYRRILEADPSHPEALHLVGLAAHQAGRHAQALESVQRAIAARPTEPVFHSNLGEIYRALGQLDAARQAYREAVRLNPGFVPAHYNLGLSYAHDPAEAQRHYERALALAPAHLMARNNLGNALRAQGRLDAAAAAFREVLARQPNHVDALTNLGATLSELGQTGEAIEHLQKAAALGPRSARVGFNLGLAYKAAGELTRAEQQFELALRLVPDFVEARCNLANALRVGGRKAEAARVFEQGLERHPDNVDLLLNYASLLQSEGRASDALEFLDRAIACRPELAAAHFNRGTALRELKRFDQAALAFQEAIRLRPQYGEAYVNLAILYTESAQPDEAIRWCQQGLEHGILNAGLYGNMATALHAQGRGTEAIQCYRKTLELRPDSSAEHSNLLYALNFLPQDDPQTLFGEHLNWARRFAEPLTAAAPRPTNDPTPGRPLRVGYVSPHFREHAVNFFTEPLLLAHDRQAFEIFCYSSVLNPDGVTQRLRAAVDRWCDVGHESDEQLAQRVRDDQIDILVDLSGHMGWNRLMAFARRPAPIQITYIGYQNTTGMSAMDYRLTDAQADPPGLTDRYYTEKLERLPQCFFCYQPFEAPEVTPLPALDRGYVTFGSFNNYAKVIPETVDAWLEILARVPRSRLLVLAYTGGYLQQHLLGRFKAKGLAPNRLEVRDRCGRADYLRLIQQVDVALDPFPFNGHTTTCDALWMGVPVVMLEGQTYVTRFGGCALTHVGLERCITRSVDAYVDQAVSLAADWPALAALRQALRPRMEASALLDFAGFTRHVEAAYRRMWTEWCQARGAEH